VHPQKFSGANVFRDLFAGLRDMQSRLLLFVTLHRRIAVSHGKFIRDSSEIHRKFITMSKNVLVDGASNLQEASTDARNGSGVVRAGARRGARVGGNAAATAD
jgi:hypothetical protein